MDIRPLDCTKRKPRTLENNKVRLAIGIVGFIIGVYYSIKLLRAIV